MACPFRHSQVHIHTSIPPAMLPPIQVQHYLIAFISLPDCFSILTMHQSPLQGALKIEKHRFIPNLLKIHWGGVLASVILFCFYGLPVTLKHRLELSLSAPLHPAVSSLMILAEVVFSVWKTLCLYQMNVCSSLKTEFMVLLTNQESFPYCLNHAETGKVPVLCGPYFHCSYHFELK